MRRRLMRPPSMHRPARLIAPLFMLLPAVQVEARNEFESYVYSLRNQLEEVSTKAALDEQEVP